MMGLSKITIVNLRTIMFNEPFFTCLLRRSQPVGMWRLSTKHSKAMKNGRLFIELGKGTNSNYYQMIIINVTNFYIKVPCFFSHAYFQFFSSFGKFFPATCSSNSAGRVAAFGEVIQLVENANASSNLAFSTISRLSGVRIPPGAPQVN